MTLSEHLLATDELGILEQGWWVAHWALLKLYV